MFSDGRADGLDPQALPHEQCLEAPLWIGKTDVTQADFVRLGGVKAAANSFEGAQFPLETLTYDEASAFCAQLGGSLPSEVEWEYAARGVSNWSYPWGDTINVNAFANKGNSEGTVEVGSFPEGVSWVGAHDLLGNVSEITRSIFDLRRFPYPYEADDGREDANPEEVIRTTRGASWFVSAAGTSTTKRDFNLNVRGITGFRYVLPFTEAPQGRTGRGDTERVDYATQKPEALIERIMSISSNESDLVLDCFYGE